MRSFFRALERRGVAYLLISGQACVVYGAATFSEDFDLWVRPTARDLAGLVLALRDVRARVHKLTPPLDLALLRRGHALHFRIPMKADPEVFVDVMLRPPRVGAFGPSSRRAERLETPWGEIPVVAMNDLAEIKKTRRPADYQVIGNLARMRLERAVASGAARGQLRRVIRWSLENAFSVETLALILDCAPADGVELARRASRPSVRALAAAWTGPGTELPPRVEDAIEARIAVELVALQRADRLYWRPIIHELRDLRRRGELLAEGAAV